jgi:predicted dithiol-disulfide oxidoreductase (DUF899 family)
MAAMAGADVATYTREREGMSAFVVEDRVIYHTYSTYARGVDAIWAKCQWLDRAPKGLKRRRDYNRASAEREIAKLTDDRLLDGVDAFREEGRKL